MSKRPASPEAAADRGREEPTIAGQVSLVERLHNIHERTASPSKRVKTDDERARAQLNAARGSGYALDLQSQSNSARATPVPGPGPAPIDLTMSDDEEIQIVKDNGLQNICIGAVKHVYVQAHAVPFPDPKKYRGNSGQHARIRVSFRRGGELKSTRNIMTVDPTGQEFGRIDYKTANGITDLMDAAKTNGLQWLAWTQPRRKQAGEGPPGTPFSGLIALTLQLYCPRKFSSSIGRYLKHKGLQLLDPSFELEKYDYHNPQTDASLQRQDANQAAFQAQPNGAVGGYAGGYRAPASSIVRSVDEIRSDVQNMFDTIISAENIPERDATPLIKTPLYPHQKRALFFMWDREQDWSGEHGDDRKDSLFQVRQRSDGQKYYYHVITGDEVLRKPQTMRGGILADEMGLGKTLSILSLVADSESQQAAKAFALKAPPPRRTTLIQQVKNSRATLLICPLSTMNNWTHQLSEHFPEGSASGLKWTRYHGSERKGMTVNDLADHDLVITTYGIVAGDVNDRSKPLQHINWFRVVLDEAHAIRSLATKQSIAACSLAAQRRWAVTGTPVQNKLEDLGALFRFIRLEPFDTTAGFNTHIITPFKTADPDIVLRLQLLVKSVTLRRLKQGVIDLPPRNDSIVRLQFSRDERRLHDWFEKDSARKVNAVTSGEKLGGRAYARILTAILHLRLICAHGRDLLSDDALKSTDGMTAENPMDLDDEELDTPAMTAKQAYDTLVLLDEIDNDKCQVCSDSLLNANADDEEDDDGKQRNTDRIGFMMPCYHVVCSKHARNVQDAWAKATGTDGYTTCQFCDTTIRPVLFELKFSDWKAYHAEKDRLKKDPKMAKKVGAYTGPHTKTKALLEDLYASKQESLANPNEPPIKSVIFSTWTTHLDLIEIALKANQHTYVRLDGRMSRQARDKSLDGFREDPSVHNILVSIGAGGLGLNLTTANKVYVMEPQFNPAAEAQAVDRVHRLGQKREVTIKRFIMEDSFEEKMLELQRKKRDLADLTMAREKTNKEQMAKQRLKDLRSLFK